MKINLTETYKNRLKQLSGIKDIKNVVSESIDFIANEGRSESGTLSFYAEEYIINLGERIINSLYETIKNQKELNLSISKSSSKMVSNNLVTKLLINNITDKNDISEYKFVLNVVLSKNGSTNAFITFKGTTSTITLNSTHSSQDINSFIKNVVEYFLNSYTINKEATSKR
jgi:hypothetical protein